VRTSVSNPKEERFRPVYENRLLRSLFGSKREETRGGLRKLHNEELHNHYSSIITITAIKTRIRSIRHLTRGRETRNECKLAVRKAETKETLKKRRSG
jgi:hypothetical protein